MTTLATGQDISERIRRAIFVGRVPKSFTRPGSVLQRSVTSDVSAELARLLGVMHVEEDAPLILGWWSESTDLKDIEEQLGRPPLVEVRFWDQMTDLQWCVWNASRRAVLSSATTN